MLMDPVVPTPSGVVEPVTAPAAPPAQPVKLGKFRASKLIVKQSWHVLRQDKELVWFPILSALCSLAFFGLLIVLYFVFVGFSGTTAEVTNDGEAALTLVDYAWLLLYYLVMFFIANFFTSGLYLIVHARFQGQDLSFSDGISGAFKNIGKIFMWSLISATVGVVLQMIADRLKIFGKIVIWLLGAAWSILTYFSLPSLIIGQKSVKDSFKESASVIRKTWGETIIVNFGVGLFFTLLYLGAMLVVIAVSVLAQSWVVFFIMLGLFVVFIIVAAIVSSTLSAIFKLAIYEYAVTGKVPESFSPELVEGAIKAKK